MVTYEQWNKAIISYFFEDCEPGEIVFLQTDANTLLEIAEKFKFNVADADKAADSLTEAVRDEVVYSGSVDFWKINPTQIFRQGNRSAEEPSQVAFLALTVLAASLMDSEGSIASNNYYIRLNELLFGQSVKGAPQGFNRLQFEEFWKHLERWLRDKHDVLLYLTEGASKRRYVWYPISQCLISKHDQWYIYCFFHDHKLTPFSDFSDDQLEKVFVRWLQASNLTKIKRYFSNSSYKTSILNQVRSLLINWNGEIPPELSQGTQGTTQATAAINVELRFDSDNNVEIRYWFRRRGRDEINCKTNPLGIQNLQPSHLEKWFRPVIDDRGKFWELPNRLRLQTDEPNPIIYTLSIPDIWIFREDPERDSGWLSQRNMRLYEDHLIVFRKRLVNQVIDCLRQTCEQEFEESSPIYVDGRENDWLYLQVEPTKFVSFSEQDLWKLSVVPSERINLIGGLSIKNQDGRKDYLDFCLPTVYVPDLGLPNEEFLSVGDKAFPVHDDRLVRLDNALEPGFHPLSYGKQSRELRVISPECSLKHHNRTLIVSIFEDKGSMPTYTVKEIPEILEGSGICLTGAKIFGDIPPPPPSDKFFKVPAHLISSVVKVAIDFKNGNTSVPDWFDEAIEYLEQNVGIQAIVEKKLNLYHETALSYVELLKQIGK